jgi:ABC-type multidrug transport system fused ATPase/permease subunit
MNRIHLWPVVFFRGILILYTVFIFIHTLYTIDLFRPPTLQSGEAVKYSTASARVPFINENLGLFYTAQKDPSTNQPCCEETRLYYGWHQSAARFSGDLSSSFAIASGVTSSMSLLDNEVNQQMLIQLAALLVAALLIHSFVVFMYIYWGGDVLRSIINQSPFADKTISNIKRMAWLTLFIPLISFVLQFLFNNIPESFEKPWYQFRSYNLLLKYAWNWVPIVFGLILFTLAKAFQKGHELHRENDLTI